MVNSNKSKQTSQSQPNKFNRKGGAPLKKSAHDKTTAFAKSRGKTERGAKGSGGLYKKPAHGKAAFAKSKEAQKHVCNIVNKEIKTILFIAIVSSS